MKKTIIASFIISGLFMSHNVLASDTSVDVPQQEIENRLAEETEDTSLAIGQIFTDEQGVIYKIIAVDSEHGYVQVGDGDSPIPNLASDIQIPETLDYQGVTFTVSEIASFAFTKYQDEGGAIAEGGSNVEIIELPQTITTIQPKAFYSSLDLRLIHFASDSQLTTIGKDAFAFSGLSKINIPDSVVEIGANAFVFNEFLIEFNLNETSALQIMGEGALRTTRQLKHIYLPASLTSIGERPFSGAIGLQSITVSPENPSYTSIDGVLFDKSQQKLITYPADHDGHSYTIPDTVTTIDDHAFEYDVNLKSLSLPNSVQHVGDLAFKNMRKLETLDLNEGLTSVGRLAFYGINQLKELTLPNSLTDYGRNPLYELDGLEKLTIGTGTTHLPANFLGGPFTQLNTVTILGEEVTFDPEMFSFFASTDWQNLLFFVSNDSIKAQLIDALNIEKEQVKLLESKPEEPTAPEEPEETDTQQPEIPDEQKPETPTDEQETDNSSDEQTAKPSPGIPDDTENQEDTTQGGSSGETSDTSSEKADKETTPTGTEDKQTKPNTSDSTTNTDHSTLINQQQINVKSNNQQPVARNTNQKKATRSALRLPQTNENSQQRIFIAIGSTLLTIVATAFYKKS